MIKVVVLLPGSLCLQKECFLRNNLSQSFLLFQATISQKHNCIHSYAQALCLKLRKLNVCSTVFSKVKACVPNNKYLLITYLVKDMLEEQCRILNVFNFISRI